ncbi:MAG: hypothetical protein WCE90_00390 [Candidatus Zixiibacteriota bacterium]
MRHPLVRWMLLAIGITAMISCSRTAPAAREIKWSSSLDEALKTASQKNRPLIAEFWSAG